MNNPTGKLERWLQETAESVQLENPQDIHFDLLLGSKSRTRQIEALPVLFSSGSSWLDLQPNREARTIMICLRLESSAQLVQGVPSWNDIVNDHHPTPPSLYLLNIRARFQPTVIESYRIPIVIPGVAINDRRIDAYFTSWRCCDDDASEGWQRQVCVWYTPQA